MTTKHNTTTTLVYEYVRDHPGDTMEEIATALHISSRANVLYHLRKLAEAGQLKLAPGKHRMFRVVEETK